MPNKAPERKAKAEPLKVEASTVKLAVAPKPQKAKESGAVVRNCLCDSPFQDRRYGRGRRVFTCTPKNGLRCTVCGSHQ